MTAVPLTIDGPVPAIPRDTSRVILPAAPWAHAFEGTL